MDIRNEGRIWCIRRFQQLRVAKNQLLFLALLLNDLHGQHGFHHLDQILLFVIELEHVVQCDRVRELALACYPGVEQCLLRAEAIYIGNLSHNQG